MVTAEVKIINESGLHLRPAGVLTQTCIRNHSVQWRTKNYRKVRSECHGCRREERQYGKSRVQRN